MLSKTQIDNEIIEKIISDLESLKFGTIQITVHDYQITQIEKIEKHRFQLQKTQDSKKHAN
ncbi:YezD family protein [Calidifontibacillus oryziterrae]|uniref:YezD family protein n=1 Tax=Calidifontibacillus oryziterrae TaxID=1191699 RepID=UPI00031960C0|nr:DUF2292 domain-containing protein [Calidifontibacillus oryziterrae]